MRPNYLAAFFFIPLSLLLYADIGEGNVSLRDARRDISRLRFIEAEEKLTTIARDATGENRQEALFLLAGLKQSASEAELIYQEVIHLETRNEWAKRAALEIAKIRYALGKYNEASRIIENSLACEISNEACLFYGLSALMLERYEEAKSPLRRVKRGRLRPWAYLALAEIEMAQDNREEACRRYKALANAMINPTALYRHAECLEKSNDLDLAKEEFLQIIENFKNTPEAILAAEKLQILTRSEAASELSGKAPPDTPVFSAGFTIQFGSFRDRHNAIKLAHKLKRILPGVRIDSDVVGSREVHRVRLGYFRTREEALSKAEEISHEIGGDYTIMPLP